MSKVKEHEIVEVIEGPHDGKVAVVGYRTESSMGRVWLTLYRIESHKPSTPWEVGVDPKSFTVRESDVRVLTKEEYVEHVARLESQ